jgi:hypothetical protein
MASYQPGGAGRNAGRNARVSDAGTAWAECAPELADWTWERLVNRTDSWGEYRPEAEVGKEFTRRDGTTDILGSQKTVRGRLGRPRLVRHFRASGRADILGLHTAGADNQSKGGALDIDCHGEGSTDAATNLTTSLTWYQQLRSRGFCPLLYESNGQGGYHLRLLLAEAIPAERLFWFWKLLLTGCATPPEQFPKQRDVRNCKKGLGNWLRLPGRHHKRPFWSRVWDGTAWLEGHDAVEFILGLKGDPASLVPWDAEWQVRVGAYLAKLPNLGEGQGRDDVAFNFLAFLVRDLKLPDDYALEWANKWDAGNTPPKGPGRLREILGNVHGYGQREYGAGLNGIPPDPPAAGGKAPREQARDGIPLGPLLLVLDRARQAPSGRVTVTLRVLRGGAPVDVLTVSATRTGRRDAARQLQALAGEVSSDAVAAALAAVFAEAARQLDEGPGPEAGPPLREAVRDYVQEHFRPTRRVGRRIFLAAFGQDFDRPTFLQLLSSEMLAKCREAARIPASEDDYMLMARVDAEMRLIFGDLVGTLPHEKQGLAAAVVAMWSVVRCLTKTRVGDEEKTHNVSLIRLTQDLLAEKGRVTEASWVRVHPGHPAFVRRYPVADAAGEVRGHEPLLGMNAELATSTGARLPEGVNPFNLKKLGKKAGVFRDVPGISGHAERKQTRVIVLSAKMTRFLLDDVSRDGAGAGGGKVSSDGGGGNYGPEAPFGAGGEV